MLKFRKKLAEKKEASKGIAKAGFTLIELLVVLVILGVLVLIAAPRFLGYSKDADVTAMQADAKVLANAALIYNVENDDTWPTTDTAKDIEIGDVTVTALALDDSTETGIGNQIQTLKGEFSDYALVTGDEVFTIATVDGNETLQKGDIVYVGEDDNGVGGVEDKDGNRHFAVNIEIPKADAGE